MKLQPSNWLDPILYDLRCSNYPIKRLQGNPKARTLLLAPVPREDELKQNLCWCGPGASWFLHNFLGVETELAPDDFLVMPCTFDGKKPVAGNTVLGHKIVAAAPPAVKTFICIGGDSFRIYFGSGKKPDMGMLTANVMRIGVYENVLVLPDPLPLTQDPGAITDRFERNNFERQQNQLRQFYRTRSVGRLMESICEK